VDRCDTVIVNFNAGRFLQEAVASALFSPAVGHVYVVDNASTDGSLDFFSERHDDRLTIVRNATNLGFGAGCNVGLSRATAGFVLLLNPDCRLLQGAVERLIAAVSSDERVGMAGPLLLNTDGSEQAGGRRAIPTPRRALSRALGLDGLSRFFPIMFPDFLQHREPMPVTPIEVEAISGACMLVRRAAVMEVGLLDEQYFLHCEDLDWCMRFRQHGWNVLFVPDAKAIHSKGVSSSHRPFATEWYKHQGMIRFYRKFFRHQYPAAVMVAVYSGVWLRFAAVTALLMFRRQAGPR
jgi:GT2 family glycosyltransferase